MEGAEQLSWFSPPVGYRGGSETPLQLLPSEVVEGNFKILGLVKRVLEEYFRNHQLTTKGGRRHLSSSYLQKKFRGALRYLGGERVLQEYFRKATS